MGDVFPATGHRYLVDFRGDDGEFRVQLDFHSDTSLTFTGVKPESEIGVSGASGRKGALKPPHQAGQPK